MTNKYINYGNLELLAKRLNEQNNLTIIRQVNKETHCPNCAALITRSKCAYCGTDFEQSVLCGR